MRGERVLAARLYGKIAGVKGNPIGNLGLAAAGAMTRFQPGNQIGRHSHRTDLVHQIRQKTDNGEMLTGFFLAIFLGDLDAIYPRDPKAEAERKRLAKRLRGQKGAQSIEIAVELSELLKPDRPRRIKLEHRIMAAQWLAVRGWGRVPQVIKVDDLSDAPLDASRLTPAEQAEARRLALKMQGRGPALTPAVITVHPTGSRRVEENGGPSRA